jgi:hypothetical protein
MVSTRSKKISLKKRNFRKTNKRRRFYKKIKMGGGCTNGLFSSEKFLQTANDGGDDAIMEYLNSTKDCQSFQIMLKSDIIFRTRDLDRPNTTRLLNLLNEKYLTKLNYEEYEKYKISIKDDLKNIMLWINNDIKNKNITTIINGDSTAYTTDIKEGSPEYHMKLNDLCLSLSSTIIEKRKSDYINFLKINKSLTEFLNTELNNGDLYNKARLIHIDWRRTIRRTISEVLNKLQQL